MRSSALQPWKWQLTGIGCSTAAQASGAHCPGNGLWTRSYAARRNVDKIESSYIRYTFSTRYHTELLWLPSTTQKFMFSLLCLWICVLVFKITVVDGSVSNYHSRWTLDLLKWLDYQQSTVQFLTPPVYMYIRVVWLKSHKFGTEINPGRDCLRNEKVDCHAHLEEGSGEIAEPMSKMCALLSAVHCEFPVGISVVDDNKWSTNCNIHTYLWRRYINCIYTVFQKNPCDYVFDDNLNSKRPIVIIFGTVIT